MTNFSRFDSVRMWVTLFFVLFRVLAKKFKKKKRRLAQKGGCWGKQKQREKTTFALARIHERSDDARERRERRKRSERSRERERERERSKNDAIVK